MPLACRPVRTQEPSLRRFLSRSYPLLASACLSCQSCRAASGSARDAAPAPLSRHRQGLRVSGASFGTASAVEAEMVPVLQGKGLIYRSPIVRMRQPFDLNVCLMHSTRYPRA